MKQKLRFPFAPLWPLHLRTWIIISYTDVVHLPTQLLSGPPHSCLHPLTHRPHNEQRSIYPTAPKRMGWVHLQKWVSLRLLKRCSSHPQVLSRALGCNLNCLEALQNQFPQAKWVPVPHRRWRGCSTRSAMTPHGDNMKKKQGREGSTKKHSCSLPVQGIGRKRKKGRKEGKRKEAETPK